MKTMISRRSFLCAAGIASASAVLTACGGSSSSTASSTASSAAASSEAASGESVELIVFAAASLTETPERHCRDLLCREPRCDLQLQL